MKDCKKWRILIMMLGIAAGLMLPAACNGQTLTDSKEAEKMEDAASIEVTQYVLSESLHTAKLVGRCAGDLHYFMLLDAPEDVIAAAPMFEILRKTPDVVLQCTDLTTVLEQLRSFSEESEYVALFHAASAVNAAMLEQDVAASERKYVAAELLKTDEMFPLPEPLEEATLFAFCYETEENSAVAFVSAEPVGECAVRVSCTPLIGGAFEACGMDALECWEEVSESELQQAQQVNLDEYRPVMETEQLLDGQWCENVVRESLMRLERNEEEPAAFTENQAISALCDSWMEAIAQEPLSCVVDQMSAEQLFAEMDLNRQWYDELRGTVKRQFEKQLPGLWLNHFVNAYGMTAVAANSMMQNLLSCEPDTCAAPPQLEGVMLVKLVWPGELTTLSAIYEENGLICVKSAFVPGLVEPDE